MFYLLIYYFCLYFSLLLLLLISLISYIIVLIKVVVVKNTNVLSFNILFLFVFFTTTTFINTIIYDIRDIKGDRDQGIVTFPVKFGVYYTKIIAQIINIVLMILLIILIFRGILSINFWILLPFQVYISSYIYLARRDRKKVFYSKFVESESIILVLFYFIGKIITII